jgi:hypothetical protein
MHPKYNMEANFFPKRKGFGTVEPFRGCKILKKGIEEEGPRWIRKVLATVCTVQ